MEKPALYETDWEMLDSMIVSNLKVTGLAAIDHVAGSKKLRDQEDIYCYSNLSLEALKEAKDDLSSHRYSIPGPGPQNLYVIEEEYFSSNIVNGVPVADPDTILTDALDFSNGSFSDRDLEAFREFALNYISADRKQEILNTYSEEPDISKEILNILSPE